MSKPTISISLKPIQETLPRCLRSKSSWSVYMIEFKVYNGRYIIRFFIYLSLTALTLPWPLSTTIHTRPSLPPPSLPPPFLPPSSIPQFKINEHLNHRLNLSPSATHPHLLNTASFSSLCDAFYVLIYVDGVLMHYLGVNRTSNGETSKTITIKVKWFDPSTTICRPSYTGGWGSPWLLPSNSAFKKVNGGSIIYLQVTT